MFFSISRAMLLIELARYASHYLCVFCVSPYSTFLLLTFIFLFFLDVLQFGIWREANSLADPSLRKIVPDHVNLQLESRLLPPYRNTDLVG